MFDFVDKRAALLRRAHQLLGRLYDQLASPDGPQFGRHFSADVGELAETLDELGHGPLGTRLTKEAGDAAETWTEAFGPCSYLNRFLPDHDLRCDAANERRSILCGRLQEVLDELKLQGESVFNVAGIELELLKLKVVTIVKASAAMQKLTRGVPGAGQESGGGPAETTRTLRRRACELLERISAQCSEAVGPREFGLRVIAMECRPDVEEAAGCLSQLDYASQARRLKVAFNAMVEEFGNGFQQDGVHELEALRSGSPPPPVDAKAEAGRERRRWLVKQAVSELQKTALELSCLVKPICKTDAASASSRGDDLQGDAKRNHDTALGGVRDSTASTVESLCNTISTGSERRRDEAVPLTGDEATDTVNKMLSNDPVWRWKQTRKWLGERGVRVLDRNEWKTAFGIDPPKTKGNVALVNEWELSAAIRAELKIHALAFDSMDELARQPRK